MVTYNLVSHSLSGNHTNCKEGILYANTYKQMIKKCSDFIIDNNYTEQLNYYATIESNDYIELNIVKFTSFSEVKETLDVEILDKNFNEGKYFKKLSAFIKRDEKRK